MKHPRIRHFALALAGALAPFEALAHGGHLGDLAGHSHWIGWGALAAGAALAALLGRKRRKEDAAAEEESVPEGEAEASGEEQPA